MQKLLLGLLLFVVVLTACGNDEKPLDNYEISLAELVANNAGSAVDIGLDDGSELPLLSPISGLKADSIYRIQAMYVKTNENKVRLVDMASVLAPKVVKYSVEKKKHDPLDVTTSWLSAHYINFRLAVKGTAKGTHYYGFDQTGYVKHTDGSRTMVVHLIHNQNNDPLYYTRETYLSLPLRHLNTLLQSGKDSIVLNVTTFKGEATYKFAL